MENNKYISLILFVLVGLCGVYFFYSYLTPKDSPIIYNSGTSQICPEDDTSTICTEKREESYDVLLELQNKRCREPFKRFKKEHQNDFSK